MELVGLWPRSTKARFLILAYVACVHDQNKSGFFGGPAFIQPIRAV